MALDHDEAPGRSGHGGLVEYGADEETASRASTPLLCSPRAPLENDLGCCRLDYVLHALRHPAPRANRVCQGRLVQSAREPCRRLPPATVARPGRAEGRRRGLTQRSRPKGTTRDLTPQVESSGGVSVRQESVLPPRAIIDRDDPRCRSYVPATLTWCIRIGLEGNPNAHAYIWWDWHKSDGERCGVKVVLLPHPATFTSLPDWKPQRTGAVH